MEDALDVSLYVPWNGTVDGTMEEELKTIESIHKNNMKQFTELKESIKTCPVLDIVSPMSENHFKHIKRQFMETENDGLQTAEKYDSEYNSLFEQEQELLHEITEKEKKSKRIKLEIDEIEQICSTLKKTYQEQKSALNIGKKIYENSFGMEIIVKEDVHTDEFTAIVTCHEGPFTFKVNRAEKAVTDFEASAFLSRPESEKLKTRFKQSPDPLALICSLKSSNTNKDN